MKLKDLIKTHPICTFLIVDTVCSTIKCVTRDLSDAFGKNSQSYSYYRPYTSYRSTYNRLKRRVDDAFYNVASKMCNSKDEEEDDEQRDEG